MIKNHWTKRLKLPELNVIPHIAFGSLILIVNILVQIYTIGWIVRRLKRAKSYKKLNTIRQFFLLVSGVFVPLLATHTVHIYIWAIALWFIDALPGYEEPIYFSLVTYTTVGYGDVTLGPDFRIFGAMASVNGILAFGLSTAFLVSLFANIFESMREK